MFGRSFHDMTHDMTVDIGCWHAHKDEGDLGSATLRSLEIPSVPLALGSPETPELD